MSYPSECPSCALGDHARHDERFGRVEGVIGGTYCDCDGGCAARFAADVAAWADLLPEASQ